MNYIYDIVLNLNNKLYDFYDWNDKDNIELYLKIPVIRIENEILKDLSISTFTVDKLFLSKIFNQTELYLSDSVKIIDYLCVFVSDNKAFAVKFNENGESILKSNLSIDEENECIEYSKSIKYSLLNYKIIKKDSNKNSFLTRNEEYIKKELIDILNNIYNNKEIDKIKYIYFELYNEELKSIDSSYNKLINLIDNNSSKFEKLKGILYLTKNKC